MPPGVTYGRSTNRWQVGDLLITRTSHASGLVLPTHDHEPATLAVVLDGDFRETIGARTFDCERGAVVLKPPGAHHSDRYGLASTALLVTLPGRLAAREVGFIRAAPAAALGSRLLRELASPDAAAALVAEGLVLELMGMAMRGAERESERRPGWLATIVEHLRAGEATGLGELAATVGRHPSHVAREFRRHFGCSPGDYHRALRLERAGEALRTTNASLSEIATSNGFYDQSHFTNAFRRHFGITPARYRTSFPMAHPGSKT